VPPSSCPQRPPTPHRRCRTQRRSPHNQRRCEHRFPARQRRSHLQRRPTLPALLSRGRRHRRHRPHYRSPHPRYGGDLYEPNLTATLATPPGKDDLAGEYQRAASLRWASRRSDALAACTGSARSAVGRRPAQVSMSVPAVRPRAARRTLRVSPPAHPRNGTQSPTVSAAWDTPSRHPLRE
jgi:hypothetical protein